jgi:hypothetical protein
MNLVPPPLYPLPPGEGKYLGGQIILIDFFLRLTYKGNNVGGNLE